MSYILKDSNEPRRLNSQSDIPEFSVARELAAVPLTGVRTFLDAGCGSGLLCRYVEDAHPSVVVHGCDISEESLAYCRGEARSSASTFFTHNLLERPTPNRYDLIVCRLVLHHLALSQQQRMIANIYASTTTGGRACLIDTDGLFCNLGTTSSSLRERMAFLLQRFGGDLLSARYHPALMAEVGFGDVQWEMIPMDFRGESRRQEVDQWRARFESSLEFYVQTLGSELEARRFFRDYLEEASKEHVSLFYNKFVVTGVRQK